MPNLLPENVSRGGRMPTREPVASERGKSREQEVLLLPLPTAHLGESHFILRTWYLLLYCSGYGKGRRSSLINAI